ncbi:hypothetical protein P280DRAFT_230398 [Massarina eburnea CBS 473.64]|uniref:Uncharacterized protein n=1 Tax=Massarina eburnea CBS 473.64 TaxID=1395130 RepID=A0A6A6SAU9_9PLEO|nr:hypothetical protein P280DRAFT_230398 [Massarina eburnea CBS 473.64]
MNTDTQGDLSSRSVKTCHFKSHIMIPSPSRKLFAPLITLPMFPPVSPAAMQAPRVRATMPLPRVLPSDRDLYSIGD